MLPPDGKASVKLDERAVQVFKIANARPSIDSMEKLRFSSCLMPSAASWPSSAMLLWRRACWLPEREAFRECILEGDGTMMDEAT